MAFSFKVRVHKRGAIVEGRADHVMDEAAEATEREVAQHGEIEVQKQLARHLKHPTGRYQSSIHTRSFGAFHEVSDGGIVYGPWLEGTGSRNAPVTRFRGYHSFRKAQAALERKAEDIADREVDRYTRRID